MTFRDMGSNQKQNPFSLARRHLAFQRAVSEVLAKVGDDVEFDSLEDFFWQEHFLREQFPQYRGQLEHRGFALGNTSAGSNMCYRYSDFGEACTNAFSEGGTLWGAAKGQSLNKK